MEAINGRLVAPAGFRDDPLEVADLLQGRDRAADLGLRQRQIAVVAQGAPVDRECLSKPRRRALVAGQEHGEDERRLAVLGRRQGGLEPVEDRTWQAVAAGCRRGVERTPAGSQAQARMARQDGREDELVVDGRHRFPFQAQGPAQGDGATLRQSSAAAENCCFPLDETASFRGGSEPPRTDISPALPDVRPAPQAGCFVSGLSVSYESQIALRHRAFGTVAVAPSSTSSSLELSASPWWVECPSAPQLSWPLAILSKPDLA